ncbi:barstar family protein [Clostridium estertheticum]|uniref:barstar family protein n=1 Tax=Clostridium estertheticum TaxID=238834 RepID=UPI0013EEB7E2|nr:barstar family protein [Clostridium estertheticum]MBZ9607630.1 barstar family protein [Clostridium estertheticum]
MKTIVLDGKDFTNMEQLHLIFKSALNLPDYYGKNLDALWDCLTGEIELPLTVVWSNFQDSKTNLGDYADKTLQLLLKAEKYFNGELKVEFY